MFDVGSVTAGNTGSNAQPTSGTFGGNNILDRDDFLMLLVSQLQHQNPLEPINNQEFIAQLAQFSSLDELQSIRESIEAQDQSNQNSAITDVNGQAISMIGKEVSVLDPEVEYDGSTPVELHFDVSSGARSMVNIYSSAGTLVDTQTVTGGQFTLDGLSAGKYYVEVTTLPDAGGQVLAYPVWQNARVTGVDFSGSATVLELEGGQKSFLANVIGVRE